MNFRKENGKRRPAGLLAAMAVVVLSAVSCQDTDEFESFKVWVSPSFQVMSSVQVSTRGGVGTGASGDASGDAVTHPDASGDPVDHIDASGDTAPYELLQKAGTVVRGFGVVTSSKSGKTNNVTAKFTCSGTPGKWGGRIGLEIGNTYNIYAYSPAGTETVTVTGNCPNASSDAMKITGIPVISAKDPLISVASCVVNDASGDADMSLSLYPGYFESGEIKTPTDTDNYVASFAMNHIFAGVVFKFSAPQDPTKVTRTFVLKSVTLSTANNGQVDLDVTFADARDNNYKALPDLNWGTPYGSGASATVFSGSKTLSATPQEISASFLPQGLSALTMTCEYDVLDQNGATVRSGSAVNAINGIGTEAGKQRVYNVTVIPTYLYQMTEGDNNSPVLTIN